MSAACPRCPAASVERVRGARDPSRTDEPHASVLVPQSGTHAARAAGPCGAHVSSRPADLKLLPV
jgi:hypothetical protein